MYKRYIYRDGKKFGPYYYESYRDKHGVARTRYAKHKIKEEKTRAVIHKVNNKRKFKAHPMIFILAAAILLIILGVIFLNYQFSDSNQNNLDKKDVGFVDLVKGAYSFITGYTADEEPSVTEETVEDPPSEPIEEPEVETEEVSNEETIAEETQEEVPVEEPADEFVEPIENETEQQDSEENITEQGQNITEPEENVTESENITEIEENITEEVEEPSESTEVIVNQTENITEINQTKENITIENVTEVNETIINVTGNITTIETIKQYGAVLGSSVKWEKTVKVEIEEQGSIGNLKVELPALSENISVKKITYKGEENVDAYIKGKLVGGNKEKGFFTGTFNFVLGLLRNLAMTARVIQEPNDQNVSVEINELILDQEEIVVEYYTEPAYSEEQDLGNGKIVKIIGPDQIHYENVLAFTELNESLNIKSKSSVKIYWQEQETYISIENIKDLDNNGIYDYVEWIVPHLSNQTFRIIVVIEAEHLDENKSFVSNIYDEVKELDDIWSEEIPESHYVRIKFETNLTLSRDVSVYPRIINGTPRIEIYEVNGTEKIAEFESLDDNIYNKVILDGLVGEQDTFDLKILNGSVEFDHIIDPSACSGGLCYFDTTYNLADVHLTETGKGANAIDVQIKWNVSDLCDLNPSSIDSAQMQFYISSKSGSPSSSVNVYYIPDQTWEETMNAATAEAQTEENQTALTLSSTDQGQYTNITVTLFVNEACVRNHDNLTMRFEHASYLMNLAIGTVTDGEILTIGQLGGITPNTFSFAAREYTFSQKPKLFVTYTEADNPPKWSDNSTNSTLKGSNVEHRVRWTDDNALVGYIFSFDNGTGTLSNSTWVAMVGVGNWSNVTKIVNSTYNSTIQWKVYSNDSDGDWNVTDTFSYLTTNTIPTHSDPIASPYPTYATNNLTCINQSTTDADGDTVTNIYNWIVDGESLMLLNLPFDTEVSSGEVRDYSGNGNNGTIVSTPTWISSGILGGAYNFPSIGKYINVSKSDIDIGENFTMNFWINPDLFSVINAPFSKGNTSDGMVLGHFGDSTEWYIEGTSVSLTYPGNGVWSMLTLACKPGNCTTYLNGSMDASTASTPDSENLFDLEIGGGFEGTWTFEGKVDEFRIYNRTLTAAQISHLYAEGFNSFQNSTIISNELNYDENWTCQVTPNDAINDGIMKNNVSVIIEETAPTHNNPSVLPISPSSLQNITCANQSTVDADADDVTNIYNWKIDGTALMAVNMPFDTNDSSVAKDYSGNGNNGTINGMTWNSSGRVGGCYDLDGNDDYIEIGSSSAKEVFDPGNNFSIAFWFYPVHDVGNWEVMFSKAYTSHVAPYYQVDIRWDRPTNKTQATIYRNDTTAAYLQVYSSGGNVELYNWYHAVMVMDASNNVLYLYLDGSLEGSDTTPSGTYGTWDTNISIGENLNIVGATSDFNGSIDDFRIYNKSLSAEQVNSLYLDTKNGYSSESVIVSNEINSLENWTCEVTPTDGNLEGIIKFNSTKVFSDPPTVVLSSPGNGGSSYSSDYLTFSCNITDDSDIVNVSLYGNWNGGWHLNKTISVTGASNTSYNASFIVEGLEDGTHTWNCLAYDNNSQSNWATANYTYTFDWCSFDTLSSSTTLTSDDCVYYNITSDDIVLDCDNFKIYGDNNFSHWGIRASGRDNISIKNCRMEEYAKVILFNNTDNSLIENNTLYNNSHVNDTDVLTYGIYLDDSDSNTILKTNITKLWSNSTTGADCYSGYLYAIYIDTSNNTLINFTTLNDINGQYRGDTSSDVGGCQSGFNSIGYGIFIPSESFSNSLDILNCNFSDTSKTVLYTTGGLTDLFVNDSNFIDSDEGFVWIQGAGGNINFYRNNFNYSANVMFYVNFALTDKLVFNDNNFYHGTSKGILINYDITNGVDIIGNTFSNITDDYISTTSDNTNISNNVLENAPDGFNDYGISINSGANSCVLQNNTLFNIDGSGSSSIYLSSAPTNISYINITNCDTGIYVNQADDVNVWHSEITNCSVDDIYNLASDNLELYNVSFNKSKVDFLIDENGFVEVFYKFRVNVTNQDLIAVESALVNNTDANGVTIFTNDATDGDGLTAWRWIMEYNQTGDANYSSGCTGSTAYIDCSTPHNITANKTGYIMNSTNITINTNKIGHVIITSPYIWVYSPVDDAFAISEPNNQTFSIDFVNVTPITIRWFIDDVEETDDINSSQYIWVGNYTQEGFYEVKVNITDANGAWDEQVWLMTVNNTYSSINLDVIYPPGNLNVSQYSFFNITLNVTCNTGPACGTVNVSLFSNNTLINATAGAIPFYTNASTNPQTTSSLSSGVSDTINFWVNATGNVGDLYEYFAQANLTNNLSITNTTSNWDVNISDQAFSVAIDLSSNLSNPINWSLVSLPTTNQLAPGNNETQANQSSYYVNVSVTGGTADLYIKANSDLMTIGGDVLGIGNETFKNATNSGAWSSMFILTTDYADNKIGVNLNDGDIVYLNFYISAPAAQPSGNYNNTLSVKAVESGQAP